MKTLKDKEEFRIYPDGWVDPGVNRSRTDHKIDAPVTQRRSWIVLDNGENPWGPFDSPKAAKDWAEAKWPGLQWADDDPQGGFWDIVALGAP